MFFNRLDALSFMKKAPGARFKVFTRREDAETFSALSTEQLVMPQPVKVLNFLPLAFYNILCIEIFPMVSV